MTDDVIAELDRWLDNSNDRTTPIGRTVVQRARDEIVGLRKALHAEHDEALEEAALARRLLAATAC